MTASFLRQREAVAALVRGTWLPVGAGMALMGCTQSGAPDAAPSIACKSGDATTFAQVCTLARMASPDGDVLILGDPQGHFRRLLITRDGRGVIAADGAEPAVMVISGDSEIEIAIAEDRYRLPATLKGKPFSQR